MRGLATSEIEGAPETPDRDPENPYPAYEEEKRTASIVSQAAQNRQMPVRHRRTRVKGIRGSNGSNLEATERRG